MTNPKTKEVRTKTSKMGQTFFQQTKTANRKLSGRHIQGPVSVFRQERA